MGSRGFRVRTRCLFAFQRVRFPWIGIPLSRPSGSAPTSTRISAPPGRRSQALPRCGRASPRPPWRRVSAGTASTPRSRRASTCPRSGLDGSVGQRAGSLGRRGGRRLGIVGLRAIRPAGPMHEAKRCRTPGHSKRGSASSGTGAGRGTKVPLPAGGRWVVLGCACGGFSR
jgi:hypothetical protein